MKQQTLPGFERQMKTTRRAQLLADMARIVPSSEVAAIIELAYPNGSKLGGQQPIELGKMLRNYFLQLWFNLSDPAAEEALYDSVSMRAFFGIDLGKEAVPDETTICKFCHLRRSSARRARPTTKTASATVRCTRRPRASSGTSG